MAICLDYQAVYHNRKIVISAARLKLVAALVLLLALSFRVWVKIGATNLGYQLASLRQEAVELDMQRRELELQRSLLLRPDNLARAARQRLGLLPLAPQRTIRLTSK